MLSPQSLGLSAWAVHSSERDPLVGSSEQYTYLGDFLRPDNGSNTVGYITRGAECGHVEFSECHLRVVQPTCKVDFLMSLLKTWKNSSSGEFISRLRCFFEGNS